MQNRSYIQKLLLVVLIFFVVKGIHAEIPVGYYNSLDRKASAELKTAVCKVITPHTVFNYDSMFSHFRYTDVYPSPNDDRWWEMYSNNYYYVSNWYKGMNREHSFPKSWWGGGSDVPAYTDLNHLYPSDAPANMAKSNYPLGEVAEVTFDNGVTKVGRPVSGLGGGAGKVFEPADEYKGDFARTYFYMVTMYQNYTWKYTYMLEQNTYPTLKEWAYKMLLRWSRQDPVSQKELDRNEVVYKRQGNRNPFIDFPELAEYIWGDKKGQLFDIADIPGAGDPVLLTPAPGTSYDFGETAINSSKTINVTFKGQNIRRAMSVKLFGANASLFKTTVSSIPAVNLNSEDGYKLPIVYTPNKIGSHTCKIVFYSDDFNGSFIVDLTGTCVEVPDLATLKATPATDITSTGFTANWEEAAEQVDEYIVTLTTFVNGTSSAEEYNADTNSFVFTGLNPQATYSYSVQSERLGYRSEPSNVITVDVNSVTGIQTDKGLIAISVEGGVLFNCTDAHSDCRIYNMQGQEVKYVPVIENYTEVELPVGVYLVKTNEITKPLKVAVR